MKAKELVSTKCNVVLPKKERYEKPLLEAQKELAFPHEILEKFNGNRFSITCTKCHHCR